MELKHYLKHIKECHSFLPGFTLTCGMYGCPKTFKVFSTFRTHVYEMHGSDPQITNQRPLQSSDISETLNGQDSSPVQLQSVATQRTCADAQPMDLDDWGWTEPAHGTESQGIGY